MNVTDLPARLRKANPVIPVDGIQLYAARTRSQPPSPVSGPVSAAELPLKQLFGYPTVAELAEYPESMRWANDDEVGPVSGSDDPRYVGEI